MVYIDQTIVSYCWNSWKINQDGFGKINFVLFVKFELSVFYTMT